MNGEVVYKLSPPLHSGCTCTGSKGEKLSGAYLKPGNNYANLATQPKDVLREGIISGEFPLKLRTPLQEKHAGSKAWTMEARRRIAENKNPPSILYRSFDYQAFIEERVGSGDADIPRGGGSPQEFFDVGYIVGRVFERKLGKYIPTRII